MCHYQKYIIYIVITNNYTYVVTATTSIALFSIIYADLNVSFKIVMVIFYRM